MTLLTLISLMFCFGILIVSADGGTQEEITRIEGELKVKIAEYILAVSAEEGVNGQMALDLARCESGLRYNAINHTSKEFSAGVYQWNLKAHPHITIEQALDPIFNVDLAIDKMAMGKWLLWENCYKTIT